MTDIDLEALDARLERCTNRVVDALDRIVTELKRMSAPQDRPVEHFVLREGKNRGGN
jgi:hypothetical protein